MSAIVLVGGGGHALVVASILATLPGTVFAGYTDLEDRGPIEGVDHLGTDAVLPALRARFADLSLALGIGHLGDCGSRMTLVQQLVTAGFGFRSVISGKATVAASAHIAAGTVVMPGAVVNARAAAGAYAIVNTNAVIEHGVRIGAHVHVAPGAIICGDSSIGDGCLIGAGAVVMQGVQIPGHCLIGAGAVVTRSVQLAGTYIGCPARRIS